MGSDEIRVGQAVYEAYAPKHAGIVAAFVPGPCGALVTVKWTDGTTSEVDSYTLNDLDDLIKDHRKKLATHEATMAKIAALGVPLTLPPPVAAPAPAPARHPRRVAITKFVP